MPWHLSRRSSVWLLSGPVYGVYVSHFAADIVEKCQVRASKVSNTCLQILSCLLLATLTQMKLLERFKSAQNPA